MKARRAPGAPHACSRLALLASSVAMTVDTPIVASVRWNAVLLTQPSGANVELRIIGTAVGSGSSARAIEVGAVEWNAQLTNLPTTGGSSS